ncbi:MAG: ABC transporter permease [Bacteroidales bacterium]|jgi:ABC-type lipoprotein release transport system permease subunit|nr:ABC transporter permease [Bacteroidales bacterium]MDX9927958.1 FtsX-like permease family protein [Bacteroidales bacterium]HNX83244.1 FtsX-like permease family protein [Bacteroidales bacterium]HOC48514.1 FtsX-like permease family protein [Bacteroidales bacterium]HPS97540.1 FtsX-like permease family protein [Bacteroidales bacterium]
MKDRQLAWRNLWRNRKRTLITAASVFFAIFFALIMRSFQLGTYDKMYSDVIRSYSGYLQLQHPSYLDEPGLDNGLILDPELTRKLEQDPNVEAVVPRIESFALAAAGNRTQGVMVIGVEPERESKALNIRNRIVRYKLTPGAVEALKGEELPGRLAKNTELFAGEAFTEAEDLMSVLGISKKDSAGLLPLLRNHTSFPGSYLSAGESGYAIIGNGLSDYLEAVPGDTIVLIGQGYHGTSAAGLYVVKGVVSMPNPEIDNRFVCLTLDDARWLYGAPDMATSAIIAIKDGSDKVLTATQQRLGAVTGEDLAVRNWKEMNALLLNQMEADNRSGAIMIGILYLVIAFGVFGTVLMMMAERRREFGMLVSIGMRKGRLAGIVGLEMLLMGVIGVIAGVIASLPIVFLGHLRPLRFTGEMARMYEDYGFEPVMPMLLPDTYYLWQVVVVLLILAVAIAFSIRKIFKLNVINALRA